MVPGSIKSILLTLESHLTSRGLFPYLWIEVPFPIPSPAHQVHWFTRVYLPPLSSSTISTRQLPLGPQRGRCPPPSGINHCKKLPPIPSAWSVTLGNSPPSSRASGVPATLGLESRRLSPGLALPFKPAQLLTPYEIQSVLGPPTSTPQAWVPQERSSQRTLPRPPIWTLPPKPGQHPAAGRSAPGFSPRPRAGAIRTASCPDLGVPRAPPSSAALQLTWVPLPAPGGPSSTARMPLGLSGAGSAAGTLGAMAAEASRCNRLHTSQVQRFQASAPRTHARTARSPLTLARLHVCQSLLPAPERDGHFKLPTTRQE